MMDDLINKSKSTIKLVNLIKEMGKIENKQLDLQWETGYEVIDFDKTKSGILPRPNSLLEYHDPGQLVEEFYFDQQMVELIDFIKKGNKLLPVLANKNIHYKDGELTISIGLYDGFHRASLASKLNIDKIPVLVSDRVTYDFDVRAWSFDLDDNNVIVSNSIQTFEIDLENYICTKDRSGNIVYFNPKL